MTPRATCATAPQARHAAAVPAVQPVDDSPCAAATRVTAALSNTHSLTRREALAAVHELEALVAWADAARAELVVRVVGEQAQPLPADGQATGRSVRDIAACELGAALGISAVAAMGLAEESRALCNWLPATLGLLREGEINRAKARIVAEGTYRVFAAIGGTKVDGPDVLAAMAAFETLVVRRIRSASRPELRRVVALAIARIAPEAVQKAHDRARDERRVELHEDADGMSLLLAHLPSLDATRVWQVLEHCARADGDAPGSVSSRMADALVAIVDGSSEMPAHLRHQAAEVQVVVSLETLLGLADDAAEIRGGHGWLTAAAVRELATDSPLRRLTASALDGRLLDFGRTTYRPPTALRDHVQARDITCRAPGCGRPATRCDVDHITSWEAGGHTSASNLACLCRRHHLLKTFAGWSYEWDDSGGARWKLPLGETVVDAPRPVLALGPPDPPS